MATIEVFADIWCPFTHVGLQRLVEHRSFSTGRYAPLWVRSWPLEIVNGVPLDADFVAEEITAIRRAAAPDLFGGFDPACFPATTMPALELAAAGYRRSLAAGEQVSLALREALFEEGRRIDDPDVLADIARSIGVGQREEDKARVLADFEVGRARGVLGSPHFFVGGEDWFCPSLSIERRDGHLQISVDAETFETFAASCFA